MQDDLIALPRVAYFSMEIAVDSGIPTYSGGLGVLAGDTMRSAADLALPLVGVTLASRAGYFRQALQNGAQVEQPHAWNPEDFARRLGAKVQVSICGREVWVAGWQFMVTSKVPSARAVPIILLDTDLPENGEEDRALTHHLYGGDAKYRLCQEIVLGIGGVRMLSALGVKVEKYHLNEGHAAFLTLELLRTLREEPARSATQAVAAVQAHCVFTTHTPVPAGHDQFDYDLALHCLGPIADVHQLRQWAGEERLNMTLLALNLSGWVNGVAHRHAEVSRKLFPGYQVHAITNGVHAWTWASDPHRQLFDRYVPQWRHEPELLLHADRIPAAELSAAHDSAKALLLEYAAAALPGCALEPQRFTMGFARRMTSYKRADLLFSDLARLQEIARRYPLQLVLAGKAHPHDMEGKRLIQNLHAWARELGGLLPVVFLPDYSMEVARLLVGGVDLWLNTPQRPLEASGTSGMKAAVNGVPSLSVLDGWWLEGWTENITGWAIGEDGPHDGAADAASLYQKLEEVVLPMYHESPQRWTEVCRASISRNGSYFNTHRMLRRYVLEAYSR